MSGLVDLHIHSSHSSDGSFTPHELFEMARTSGMKAMSISDHDTVSAYPQAVEESLAAGVELIPSVELTTLLNGREFHCLLPFVDPASPALRGILAEVAEIRGAEARERIRKLQDLGFDISWEEVTEESGNPNPLGVTIAQVLAEKSGEKNSRLMEKYVSPQNRPMAPYIFYKDYFLEGKPAYVTKRHISLLRVLEKAPECGAVPVLAHPGAYFEMATREDLELLKEHGLDGLEVFSTYHDKDQVTFYAALAKDLDLVVTAGSDFHGKIKPHIPFGSLKEGHYGMIEDLRKRRGK